MPRQKKDPPTDMDLYGYVSPQLRELRNKPNKTPEDWERFRAMERARREPVSNLRVDTPQTVQNNGTLIPAARNNNPGNLEPREWQRGMRRRSGERFATFDTPEIGFLNLVNSVRRYQSNNHTVRSFYEKYAPRFENNTDELVRRLRNHFGVSDNTPLRYINPRELASFIARQESSTRVSFENGSNSSVSRDSATVPVRRRQARER